MREIGEPGRVRRRGEIERPDACEAVQQAPPQHVRPHRDADVAREQLLDDREIVRFCQLLLAAGTETTTNLIDNAVLSFLEHPAELARLRANGSLLPSAIEEVLRYRTPVQAMFRATVRELELDGTAIPANKMIGAANRDPRRFPDPHRFDIARAPNAQVAFGHGIHFCLGAPLSRLEARIALGDLLERFSRFTLASEWEPRSSFHVHGPRSLSIACER